MEQFQVSRTGLLESCQRIFDFDIADKRVFLMLPGKLICTMWIAC